MVACDKCYIIDKSNTDMSGKIGIFIEDFDEDSFEYALIYFGTMGIKSIDILLLEVINER